MITTRAPDGANKDTTSQNDDHELLEMQPFSLQIEDDMTRQAQFQLSFQKIYVKHDDDDDDGKEEEEEDADDEGARGKFRKSIIVFISESLSLISLV